MHTLAHIHASLCNQPINKCYLKKKRNNIRLGPTLNQSMRRALLAHCFVEAVSIKLLLPCTLCECSAFLGSRDKGCLAVTCHPLGYAFIHLRQVLWRSVQESVRKMLSSCLDDRMRFSLVVACVVTFHFSWQLLKTYLTLGNLQYIFKVQFKSIRQGCSFSILARSLNFDGDTSKLEKTWF